MIEKVYPERRVKRIKTKIAEVYREYIEFRNWFCEAQFPWKTKEDCDLAIKTADMIGEISTNILLLDDVVNRRFDQKQERINNTRL